MLRIVPDTVPRVGRSYEHFPDGFELHFLGPGFLRLTPPRPCRRTQGSNTLQTLPPTPLHSTPSTPYPLTGIPRSLERLVICCPTTGVSAAHATQCATYCTPCRSLIRAFSGWIRTPPPSPPSQGAATRRDLGERARIGLFSFCHPIPSTDAPID